MAATGVITTVAGIGIFGGSGYLTAAGSSPSGPAISAQLNTPLGVALDAAGNLYIADSGNLQVYRVDAATGVLTTVAGSGALGFSGDGGPATSASFNAPYGLVVDAAGDLYITDYMNERIRKVTSGTSTSGYTLTVTPQGTGTGLVTSSPAAIVCGEGYVECSSEFEAATVVTLIPSAAPGSVFTSWSGACSGTDTCQVTMSAAAGVTANFASASSSSLTLTLSKSGTGTGTVTSEPVGVNCGMACTASFSAGSVITLTATPDPGMTFAGWSGAGCSGTGTCQVTLSAAAPVTAAFSAEPVGAGIITTYAGTGVQTGLIGDGGPAVAARVYSPEGIAMDTAGNLYIAEYGDARVREVAASGVITTVAGNGTNGYKGDGGPATSAELKHMTGVAVDAAGDLYIVNGGNSRIRAVNTQASAITVAGVTIPPGDIATVAGSGTSGYSGDGNAAISAKFSFGNLYSGVAVDAAGNLYIADHGNNRVRAVNAQASTISVLGVPIAPGNIATVAGNGTSGYSGDSGLAINAEVASPAGLALDATGNLYIADSSNQVIRQVNAKTGNITTVAGIGTSSGYSGDGGPATSAQLNSPEGVALDATGNLWIADSGNNRIREVDAVTGVITTVAGLGTSPGNYSGDGGPAVGAKLNSPLGEVVDAAGNLYFADNGNSRIRKVTPASPGNVLTVNPQGTGTGVVFSLPAGIDCGTIGPQVTMGKACADAFQSGTVVTLFATATSGSTFAGWSGGGCTGTGSCQVTMNAAGSVTATFNTTTYSTLSVSKLGLGTGTISSAPAGIYCGTVCSASFNVIVTLTASPDPGSTFAGWSGGGCTGTGSCQVTMNAAASVTATFNVLPSYPLSVAKSGTGTGRVTSAPEGIDCGATCSAPFNQTVTLTAVADAGSTFTGWDACTGTGTCQVPMTAAAAVTATFTAEPLAITNSFGAATIPLNGTTLLTFSVNNPNPTSSMQGVAFTDSLPAGLVVATPINLNGSCGGGTITAAPGGSTVSLSGATLAPAPNGNCTFSVNVIGTAAGVFNDSVTVSSTTAGTGTTALASLTVVAPPALRMAFEAASLPLGGSTSLTFTLINTNSSADLAGVGIADSLPAGLVVSSPNGLTGTCGGGTITATAASGTISLSGGTIATGGNCTFAANVTGVAAGNQINAVAATSTNGGTGNTATASVTVLVPDLTISKSHTGNFTQGQSGAAYALTVSNTGAGPTSGAVTVSDTLPAGLTATAIGGTGWTCSLGTLSCTRSDALPAGSSYPVITLTVSVVPEAPASVTNTATVSGGGESNTSNDTASDPTTIVVNAVTPVITSLYQPTIQAGSPAFTLTVNGSGFMPGAGVRWNGSDRTSSTTWVSSSQLTVPIVAADIASAGTADVTVANPAIVGGVVSARYEFVIDSPATATGAFTASSAQTLTVTHGQSAQLQVTFTGTATGATITATCVNLPTGATCSYSNGVVTITAAANTPAGNYPVIVIFTETQQMAARMGHAPIYLATSFGLMGLPLGLLWIGGGRKKAFRRFLIALIGLLLVLSLAGCGGSAKQLNPDRDYTIVQPN